MNRCSCNKRSLQFSASQVFLVAAFSSEHWVPTDMMSRSYLPAKGQETYSEFEAVNVVQFLPIGQERLEKFRLETERDGTMQVLKTTILKGWPEEKSGVSPLVTPYYSVRDELSIYDGLVFKGERLVVPQALRAEIKKELHASHAGVEGCLRRGKGECLLAKYEL